MTLTNSSPEILHQDFCFFNLRWVDLTADHGAERHLVSQLLCYSQCEGSLEEGEVGKELKRVMICSNNRGHIQLKLYCCLASEWILQYLLFLYRVALPITLPFLPSSLSGSTQQWCHKPAEWKIYRTIIYRCATVKCQQDSTAIQISGSGIPPEQTSKQAFVMFFS